MSATVHATAVRWLNCGLLIQGPSGAGKSDLAIQLIENGAVLVADDLVLVTREADGLWATGPRAGQGLIELRGQGLYRLSFIERVRLDLAIMLLRADDMVRLPEPATLDLLGMTLPQVPLASNGASNVARLRIAITAAHMNQNAYRNGG